MTHFFQARERTDCTKCQYSRRIPLSSQLTCTHPLASVQRNLDAGAHGMYRSTPNFSRRVPAAVFSRQRKPPRLGLAISSARSSR
jgi:hypothetical protein